MKIDISKDHRGRLTVREAGTPPHCAEIVREMVHAKGVTFVTSRFPSEEGFGCSTIVHCESVVAVQSLPKLERRVPLSVSMVHGFYVAGSCGEPDQPLQGVAEAVFYADGTMLAGLNEAAAATEGAKTGELVTA